MKIHEIKTPVYCLFLTLLGINNYINLFLDYSWIKRTVPRTFFPHVLNICTARGFFKTYHIYGDYITLKLVFEYTRT